VLSEGARVTSLELFFDLVFVYAITQITQFMASDPTGRGVLRGMLMLAILWWCWSGYCWLGNRVQADEGAARLVLFAVMLVMLIAAVTIPEAFHDLPGGLNGPIVFAACYLIVRLLHLFSYWQFAVGNDDLRRQLTLSGVPMMAGTAVLVAASFTSGPTQTALWAVALLVDYGGVLLTGSSGWTVHSAAHFAERHGLIIIIALGESIVSVGVGVADLPISWPIIFGIACGVVISGALWWAYFDVVALVAERVLLEATGAKRSALARDSFSYLHLPMIAGIVLMALGLKKVMNYLGGAAGHSPGEHMHGVGPYALYGGVVLYLLGHLGFRLRNIGSVNFPRLVVSGLLLVLLPVSFLLPAYGVIGLLTLVCVGWISFEVWRYDVDRRAIREQAHEH
jgi:low temperature requirement protein LtrA